MTENIVQVGSEHVTEVQDINKNLVEKTLRMRALAYLSQVKSQLLVETIYDMNHSRQELAELSSNLAERNKQAEAQKHIIEQQKQALAEQNKELEIERDLLELKVEERTEIEKQAKEIVKRSQKMDSIGKLTSGIAHDYNNMLGVINGYAELLEKALSSEPTLAKYAHKIHHAGKRGALLTKKLLDFSRKKTTEADVLNINTLLLEVQQMLEKTLTARIQLVLDLSDDLWPVWVDSGDLEDAIINMGINAMHAIEGHGRLTIQTRNEKLNRLDAHILQLAVGDYVLLSITDTGSGMDTSTKEKIFEPFYSTKGDKGTGLGLSQVYGFVERSNGAIKIYSEPGQGASFMLYFPRHHETSSDDKSEEYKNAVDITGNETILIVDDEPVLRDLASELLGEQGYKIICAKDARQALNILEDKSIDLLFSDVIMPEIDGYQLAATVLEKYPAIKIQLVSGLSDTPNMNMVDDSLHRSMIYKPYNTDILLKRIRELLDEE